MMEECPYWSMAKFKQNVALNDICGHCRFKTNCNVLNKLTKDPEVVIRSSGGFRKPKPKFKTDFIVICKDCGKDMGYCRCRKPSGYTFKKKEVV